MLAPSVDRARVDLAAVLFDVGRRVAELRTAKGLTQEQLSEASGIDVKNIQKIEGGVFNLTIRTLVRLGDAMELPDLQEFFDAPESRAVRPGRPKGPGGAAG